jgi:hypothetical protein
MVIIFACVSRRSSSALALARGRLRWRVCHGASGRGPSKGSSSTCIPSTDRTGLKRSGMCLRIQRCSAVPW